MGMRIVAVVVLVGLAFFIWQRRGQVDENGDGAVATAEDGQPEIGVPLDTTEKTPPYFDPDVEGVEPDEAPQIDITWELTHEGPRSVLNFTVTERQGWYVDHVYLEFWCVAQDEDGEWREMSDPVVHLCKGYIDFNGTLTDNTTLLDIEFPDLDEYNTTEHWRVRLHEFNKVLAPKPKE